MLPNFRGPKESGRLFLVGGVAERGKKEESRKKEKDESLKENPNREVIPIW